MKNFFRAMFVLMAFSSLTLSAFAPAPQGLDPEAPDEVVKLIFIHHSTGENWLTDGYGNLGRELGRSNYFVSDTNYGWGPDTIGDRTDIPNWMEWFRSAQTPAYMEALFNESGQHSGYTRTLADPGGENQIILFKSCFPNSALAGSPNDPPGTYEDLSVGGAKYTYNQLLTYFAARPDKLFVVITAPPLSDASQAKNARAFNQWLVNDWLQENNYTAGNVAVFDFYNVLTGANAHHRYRDGAIEHVVGNRDTLYYPSGDDHPSEKGSRKATEEFIPLLNIFYHSWKENAPLAPPAQSSAAEEEGAAPAEGQPAAAPPAAAQASAALIDDFEGGAPAGSNGWEAFRDEATPTTITCGPDAQKAAAGAQALALDFDVAPGAWATCALFFEQPQDWSSGEGLAFYLNAAQAGLVFDVDIYAGTRDAQETYLFTLEAPPASADGWVPISLSWSDFHRADWEEGAGSAFAKPEQIVGVAFGVNTYPDTPNTGKLWVDDLALLGQGATGAAPQSESAAPEQQAETKPGRKLNLPCGSAFLLPVFLICAVMAATRRWF